MKRTVIKWKLRSITEPEVQVPLMYENYVYRTWLWRAICEISRYYYVGIVNDFEWKLESENKLFRICPLFLLLHKYEN